MNEALILTNDEIEKILANENCEATSEEEYTPWFLDSVQDLEEELFCA